GAPAVVDRIRRGGRARRPSRVAHAPGRAARGGDASVRPHVPRAPADRGQEVRGPDGAAAAARAQDRRRGRAAVHRRARGRGHEARVRRGSGRSEGDLDLGLRRRQPRGRPEERLDQPESGLVPRRPPLFVMELNGSNFRQITSTGFHTQPRWSPKGDTIVYTQREGTHDLWAVSPDGTNPRRLTAGLGDNEGAAWAPNGRHLAFQSNRLGRWQVFAMLLDGSPPPPIPQDPAEHPGASWAPRLQ